MFGAKCARACGKFVQQTCADNSTARRQNRYHSSSKYHSSYCPTLFLTLPNFPRRCSLFRSPSIARVKKTEFSFAFGKAQIAPLKKHAITILEVQDNADEIRENGTNTAADVRTENGDTETEVANDDKDHPAATHATHLTTYTQSQSQQYVAQGTVRVNATTDTVTLTLLVQILQSNHPPPKNIFKTLLVNR